MKRDDSDSGQRSFGQFINVWTIAMALVIPGILLLIFQVTRSASPTQPDSLSRSRPTSEPSAEYQNPAGYVGPEKCVQCHADRVEEFKESRHYLACVMATDETMPAVFLTDNARYTPLNSSVTFQMMKDAGQFVQLVMHDEKSAVRQTRTPISLMYGYGAATDEVYFSWNQNKLSELPMSWLHPHQEWGTSGFDRLGTGDFSRPTNPRCLECHNTWLEHVPGTSNEYRPESLIPGVTCEVCHGPALEHVNFHQLHPDAKTPMHITQPSQLSRRLQLDLCANCHSNALKHQGPAFSYRPGKPLDEFYQTLVTLNPEDDHVANQTTYLQQSKCFQESHTLTCITCHDPHAARDMHTRGVGQSACLSCHQQQNCKEQTRLPEAVKDNCVGCHMPRRSKVQVNFDTAGDPLLAPVPRWEHRIAVDTAARDEILLEWYKSQSGDEHAAQATQLTQLLAMNYEHDGDSLSSQFRFLAAADQYRKSLALSGSENSRKKFEEASATHLGIASLFNRAEHELAEHRIDDGIQTLKQLLLLKPDHAKAHGRLGTLYAMKHEDQLALEQWSKVATLDPNDAYGVGMIGWYSYLKNQPDKAVEALLRADQIEPYSFRINYNLALALTKQNRLADAALRFQAANRIEPQNIECALLVNEWLRQHGQFIDAVDVIGRLSERTDRQVPVVEMALADSQADAGRIDAALETLDALRRKIAGRDPGLAREIAERCQELKSSRSDTEQ